MRIIRYFTRPMLVAADRERQEAGIPDHHSHPPFRSLKKKHRYYVYISFPFWNGTHHAPVPFMRVYIWWLEGGLRWWMDVTLTRHRRLPKVHADNPHFLRD